MVLLSPSINHPMILITYTFGWETFVLILVWLIASFCRRYDVLAISVILKISSILFKTFALKCSHFYIMLLKLLLIQTLTMFRRLCVSLTLAWCVLTKMVLCSSNPIHVVLVVSYVIIECLFCMDSLTTLITLVFCILRSWGCIMVWSYVATLARNRCFLWLEYND
jgi:hypothetical protein